VSEGARVALTFDAEHPDRPSSGDHTDAILTALADRGLRGSFFLQGRWVEAMPYAAQAIASAGHLIGNHSHYHARMPLFSPHGLSSDVESAESAIRTIVGVDPRPWFRAPFGSGAERPELLARLAELGYRHVGWDIAAEEWLEGKTAGDVSDAIVAGVRARGDGAIVLLHTWPDPVVDGLSAAIDELGADGVRFVGVDELDLPAGLESIGEPRPGAEAPPVGANW
jgi:peptidoglycan/xylan/chitin deacetylase (PgdA/CDA1 family)